MSERGSVKFGPVAWRYSEERTNFGNIRRHTPERELHDLEPHLSEDEKAKWAKCGSFYERFIRGEITQEELGKLIDSLTPQPFTYTKPPSNVFEEHGNGQNDIGHHKAVACQAGSMAKV